MTKILSGLGAGIVAVAAMGALAGCSAAAGTANAATTQLEQRTITVDSVPAAEEAALYVAQAQGLFARQGLTVKIRAVTDGAAAIPDLQSNSAQLAVGSYVPFVLAQLTGQFGGKPASLRIIAPGGELMPGTEELYVMPGSKFQTVPELARAHAPIGLDSAHDVGDVLLGALLTDNGYSLGAIHQVTPASGFPGVLSDLLSGQVDAAWLPQPLGEEAEQQHGAVPIADFDQGLLDDFPFTGYTGTTHWVKTHPNTVAAFLRALRQGDELADTDRSAVEAAAEHYLGVQPIIAATMAINTYPLTVDVPQLKRVTDAMYEFGLTPTVKAPYDIASMIQAEPGEVGG